MTVTLFMDAASSQALVDLFTEVHRATSLTKLNVCICGHEEFLLPLSAGPAGITQTDIPSLQACTFSAQHNAFMLRPHWEFTMSAHAATLRKVHLLGLTWPPGLLQASVFNSLHNLEELTCPLLEDMDRLKCSGLQKLTLYPGFGVGLIKDRRVSVAIEYAKAFFCQATSLKALALSDWRQVESLAGQLFRALTSSGRSQLEKLVTRAEAGVTVPNLQSLSLLQELHFAGKIPADFFEQIAVTRLPSLTAVKGEVQSCAHALLESRVMRNIMCKNPQLQVMITSSSSTLCCKAKQCQACKAGGCEDFLNIHGLGVCGQPVGDDAHCPLQEEHAKNSFYHWVHLQRS